MKTIVIVGMCMGLILFAYSMTPKDQVLSVESAKPAATAKPPATPVTPKPAQTAKPPATPATPRPPATSKAATKGGELN